MSEINFPNSPTLGQTYSFNNISWQWNGSSWIVASPSASIGYVETFNGLTGDVQGVSNPKHWFIG